MADKVYDKFLEDERKHNSDKMSVLSMIYSIGKPCTAGEAGVTMVIVWELLRDKYIKDVTPRGGLVVH